MNKIDRGRTFQFVRFAPQAFSKKEVFTTFVTDSIVAGGISRKRVVAAFDDDLQAKLFDIFRGRARRVANLASTLLGVFQSTRDVTTDILLDAAQEFRMWCIDPAEQLSVANRFVESLAIAKIDHQLLAAAKSLATNRSAIVSEFSKVGLDLFELGVASLRVTDGVAKVDEPLALEALLASFAFVDRDGSKGLNPLFWPLADMTLNKSNASVLGFLAERLVAPFVHRHLAHALGAGVGDDVLLMSYPNIANAVTRGYRLFSPDHRAHPDAVHTFDNDTGALGHFKYTRSMTSALWAHAVRTTTLDALFRVDADPANAVIKGCSQLRQSSLDVLGVSWSGGYVSYVFTLAEPPKGTTSVKQLAAGESGPSRLFVFSPKLTPDLFGKSAGVCELLMSINHQG